MLAAKNKTWDCIALSNKPGLNIGQIKITLHLMNWHTTNPLHALFLKRTFCRAVIKFLPSICATVPNGEPDNFIVSQVKFIAMFNLARSENVGLTNLKVISKRVSEIVNLKKWLV
jgi:hypothetical protein